MSESELRLRPVVTWPARAEPGNSYLVSVDLETDGPLDAWPYPQEEYPVGCMLDGGSGFAVESVGDTTLVVHRFGGTYGPVTFVAHALDTPGRQLNLTLITQGGVPFRTIPLNVDRPVLATIPEAVPMEAEPRRRYVLVPYPPEPEPLGDPRRLPPSRVLTAAAHAAPFTGREAELNRLGAWLEGGGRRATLLHGPGGQGKTRLAAEFARQARAEGWHVLAARPGGDHAEPVPPPEPSGEARGSGLLLVVDYAESWQIEDLLEMLAEIAADGERPVRVLLLARPSGAWWRALAHGLASIGMETTTMELGSLLGSGRARLNGLIAAVEWFAGIYGQSFGKRFLGFSSVLTDPAYEQVLAVQMAALTVVLNEATEVQPVDVTLTLLGAEHTFWSQERDRGAITTSPVAIGDVMFIASLAGPLLEDEAEDILTETGIPDPATALRDYGHCFPPAVPGTVLQPVSPDRLGEDYVAFALRDQERTSGVLAALLDGPAGPSAVGVLVEAARRWPHVADQLNARLRENPAPAVAAGGAVLLRLAEMPDVDPSVLEAIEEQLPLERRIDLDIAGAVLAERLFAPRISAAVSDPDLQADLYERLSERRANVGMYEEAGAAADSAVAIRRSLLAEHRDPFHADALAGALNTSSYHLGRMGRHEESLEQLTESVARLRTLAAEHPRAFRARLASALNGQALELAELGRRRESLDAASESVALHRELDAEEPARLASALNNLSARLASLGRLEEALAAVEEAVAIHRALDDEQPDAHLPAMAAGLHNRSLRLAALGRSEESVKSAMEAVRLWRRLATTVPDAYEAGLAGALANLAVQLGELGRAEDAVAAALEAVHGYRELTEQRPDAYLPDLAAALNNYSVQLGRLDRIEDALGPLQEAVAVYRRLADQRPGAYLPDLAAALNNLAVRLGDSGDSQAGLEAIQEAVAIRRRLVEDDPAGFEADLAVSLANLGVRLEVLGRDEESLAAVTEAVEIYRRLAAEQPEAFQPALSACMGNLAAILGRMGRLDEALGLSAEVIVTQRRLHEKRPSGFRAVLAQSLNNHSVFLRRLGRIAEALTITWEAVELYRDLTAERTRKAPDPDAGNDLRDA